MTDQRYRTGEKLKQKKEIDMLFSKGKWKTVGALRVISLPLAKDNEQNTYSKVGVSVSKRYFKKATDRNRIKRLLRECYRLNKERFADKFGQPVIAMLFWASKEKPAGLQEVQAQFEILCRTAKQNSSKEI